MISFESSEQDEIDDVFHAYLRGFNQNMELLGKRIPYHVHSGFGQVDILRVDIDERYAEFIEVESGSFSQFPSYETLAKRTQKLKADWDYSIERVQSSSLKESPSDLNGNIYYEDDDIDSLNSNVFREFSSQVFGENLLELERVDPEKLNL